MAWSHARDAQEALASAQWVVGAAGVNDALGELAWKPTPRDGSEGVITGSVLR